MPRSIEFTASFGDEEKHVELSFLDPGGWFQIYINRYSYGAIVMRQGKWTVLLQDRSDITMDDIQAIEEIIEESYQ